MHDLLQELVISSQDDDVIDDCLQLIRDYSCVPLTILEQEIEKMKDAGKLTQWKF